MKRNAGKILVVLLLLTWLGVSGCAGWHSEPENLATVRERLIKYHDQGDYDADLTRALKPAYRYLETTRNANEKQAVVFDVDETALSNWKKMLKVQFGSNSAATEEWIMKGEAPAIGPTLELYTYARKLGYGVFFITGRNETKRAVTEANLKRAGFTDYEKLILYHGTARLNSAAEYKEPARAEIEATGWKIILNVGDQQSDLTGEHSGRNIKLPNPFYHIK